MEDNNFILFKLVKNSEINGEKWFAHSEYLTEHNCVDCEFREAICGRKITIGNVSLLINAANALVWFSRSSFWSLKCI